MELLEIGQALLAARNKRNLSQEQVAAAVKIGRSTLSRLENGTIEELGVRKIIRLCEFYGLRLAVVNEGPMPTLNDLVKEHKAAAKQAIHKG